MSNFGMFFNFGMPALQIWPCHVTQEANFEKKLYFPNSEFNIRNVAKFVVEKLSTSEVNSKKTDWGWKTPPSWAFRVKAPFVSKSLFTSLVVEDHIEEAEDKVKAKIKVEKTLRILTKIHEV